MRGCRSAKIKQALNEFSEPNPNGSLTFKVFCEYNYPKLASQAHEIWLNRHKFEGRRKIMSKESRTAIASEVLIDLTDAIEANDRQRFLEIFRAHKAKLQNAITGDAYLSGKAVNVFSNALDNFIA